MFVESVELKNYRNYEELHMEFDPGTNVLYGDNAHGVGLPLRDHQVPQRQQG